MLNIYWGKVKELKRKSNERIVLFLIRNTSKSLRLHSQNKDRFILIDPFALTSSVPKCTQPVAKQRLLSRPKDINGLHLSIHRGTDL